MCRRSTPRLWPAAGKDREGHRAPRIASPKTNSRVPGRKKKNGKWQSQGHRDLHDACHPAPTSSLAVPSELPEGRKVAESSLLRCASREFLKWFGKDPGVHETRECSAFPKRLSPDLSGLPCPRYPAKLSMTEAPVTRRALYLLAVCFGGHSTEGGNNCLHMSQSKKGN